MDYISVREAAIKWRIKGQQRMGHMWLIPKDAEKPDDPRMSREKGGR